MAGGLRGRLFGALALACGAGATSLFAQTPSGPRPADLPVTRLEGASGTVAAPPPQQTRPGTNAPLPVTRLDGRGLADLDGTRTISLTSSQPVALRDLLLLLVRDTPFSVVADESVGGSFTGELKEMTMREAIEAVLFPRDLDYDVQGDLIRVFSRKPQTRLYPIDYLNVRRTSQRSVRSTVSIPAQVAGGALSSSIESDRFDELTKGIVTLLSSVGRVHIDRTAGIVQVTDFAERLDQIGVYVEAVHLRATRQVRIDARVFEVTLNDASAMSIDWGAIAARTGGAAQGLLARGAEGITVGDIGALVTAIGEQGIVKMIAAPQIVAMNNEPAIMRVGTQEVYFVSTADSDVTGQTRQTSSPGSITEGLTLTVVAQIAADGIVQLSVAPSYAEKTGESKSKKGDPAPVLSISEADTIVRLQDGETLVLSGFLRRRDVARQSTGVSGVFGGQKHEIKTAELVVVLTPTVVRPGVDTRGSR
jgi:MSHA biogenesis protein MshL